MDSLFEKTITQLLPPGSKIGERKGTRLIRSHNGKRKL